MSLRQLVLLAIATTAISITGISGEPAQASSSSDTAAMPEATTFETGGVTIWFEVRGEGAGTPLVLVNGGPGFDHTYLTVSDAWDRLSRRRKIVFYDQRGNGRSSPLKEGQACGLAEQIADLEPLREHLGFQKIDLLGHSWGGYLVMAYAARHPERIAHLLIVDSAAPKIQDTAVLFKNIYPETTARQDAVAFAAELGNGEAIAADMKEYLSMLFYSPEARDRFLVQSSSFVFRQQVSRLVWNDLQRFDLNPELAKFHFPTLVVTGRYDFNVAPSVAWTIHRAIPGSEFAVYEKSGHLPFYEEADSFVERLEAFLK